MLDITHLNLLLETFWEQTMVIILGNRHKDCCSYVTETRSAPYQPACLLSGCLSPQFGKNVSLRSEDKLIARF